MKVDENFKFYISLSSEGYFNKEIATAVVSSIRDKKAQKIRHKYGYYRNHRVGFSKCLISADKLLDALLHGKMFCNIFSPSFARKDGTFSTSEKSNLNFQFAQVIGIDIDKTSYKSVSNFIDKLSLKPTFYYTTYTNRQDDPKFRLIYVFEDRIDNPYLFRYCACKLNKIIEHDVEEPIVDTCNLNCCQYFNGTHVDNPDLTIESGIFNYIYNLDDIKANPEEYKEFLCNFCDYATFDENKAIEIANLLNQKWPDKLGDTYQYSSIDNKFHLTRNLLETKEKLERLSDIDIFAVDANLPNRGINLEDLAYKWDHLTREEFLKYPRWINALTKTKYIYRKENDWNDQKFQFTDDDYFSLYFYTKTVKDGDKRRKSLYERMCLRKILCPDILVSDLVVCCIIDIIKFYDNSDNVLNGKFLLSNANSCFLKPVKKLKEQYKDTIEYLKSNNPKKGIIYADKEARSKETTFEILDQYYNPELSINENIEHLNKTLGFDYSKRWLYIYLKERNITPKKDERNHMIILENIDTSLSIQKNVDKIKSLNIKCSKDTIGKMIKLKKEMEAEETTENVEELDNISK